MLRDIAERDNLTIAAVIHSPGPACFDAFSDYLLLQTGGRLVYAGKTRGVTDFDTAMQVQFNDPVYPRDEVSHWRPTDQRRRGLLEA